MVVWCHPNWRHTQNHHSLGNLVFIICGTPHGLYASHLLFLVLCNSILAEVLFIWEETDHPWLDRMLQLIQELHCFYQAVCLSLGCQNLFLALLAQVNTSSFRTSFMAATPIPISLAKSQIPLLRFSINRTCRCWMQRQSECLLRFFIRATAWPL